MAEVYCYSVYQASGKIGVDIGELVAAIRSRKLYAKSKAGRYYVSEPDLLAFADWYFTQPKR